MNANEIADLMSGCPVKCYTQGDTKVDFHEIANFIRQQQAEIVTLKQILAYEGIGVSQEYLDECVSELRKAQKK